MFTIRFAQISLPGQALLLASLLCLMAQVCAQPGGPDEVPLTFEERVSRELMAKISDWAGTWQAQLPDLYIAHYTLDYVAPGFASRQAWLADRRERLVAPDYIRLRLVDFELVSLADDEAVARFTLIYERPGYSDETVKELVFSNRNGLWLISAENNLSVKPL